MKEKGARISISKLEKNDLTSNVDIKMSTSTSQVLKVNDEETIMVLGGEGKFEQTRETTTVLGGEEENEQAIEEVNDEGNTKEEAKDEDNLEATKKKVSKLRKRGKKKKIALRRTKKVVVENTDNVESSHKKTKPSHKNTDKVESSHKKTTTTKVEGMGMIFMCSSKTKKDCYHYKVLGLPASKRDIVLKIYKGMRLFLFDYDLKLLYGIYKATGPGGYNIEPKAFKSAFPSQVRFTVVEDCLPLAEEKFKKVIKDNYYRKNKFNCQLTSDQVKNLCKLYRAASKGPKSRRFHNGPRAETHTFVDRNRPRWQDWEQERRPAFVRDRLYLEHPVAYERERPVPPLALCSPLGLPTPPAPGLPPSYGYGRNLATEVYRRDPFLEHHERRPLDLELRHQDKIERRDSYILYRERPLYYDPLYSSSQLPEYHTPAGPPPEYHPSASLTSVYRPPRPLYRY